MQYPLSRDEHAAMARYLSSITKHLQDVCELFTVRYGKNSSLAEVALKTLGSSTVLEHEFMLLEGDEEEDAMFDSDFPEHEAAAVTSY